MLKLRFFLMATAFLCAVVYAAPPKKTMTDPRDGQKYKTVQIGSQTWMAQNLNYKTDNSFCYGDKESNCAKYGRLYTWDAAVGRSEKECGYQHECNLPSGDIRGVCPQGWHLPSRAEFGEWGAKALKSKTGWIDNGNGTDAYGFSALPAGVKWSSDGDYDGEGELAHFWSSTEEGSVDAYHLYLRYNDDTSYLFNFKKNVGFSVRCLKDDSNTGVTPQSSFGSASVSNSKLSEPAEGTLTDPRDGQKYKTVRIGSQTWMAQNLNYKTDNSWCCGYNESNCQNYARLYTWKVARSACPAGWHLPSKAEFETLFEAVGGKFEAGKMLKSTSGWDSNEEKSGNGTDAFAFSALPAGVRLYDGGYGSDGLQADFWSSTEFNSQDAYALYLLYNLDEATLIDNNKDFGLSVRCLKN
jgi:uncharacterized protein (TIGR02145 family)